MRDEPNIAPELLRECLQDEYGLVPAKIEFLPIGRDLNAGVYRVVSDDDSSYLLKAKSGAFYGASCTVPRYLHNRGITAVVAPVPTRTKGLWVSAGQWTVVLYPYLEGETGWATMTDEHWKAAGSVLRRIHEVPLPPDNFEGVRTEAFDPSGYAHSVESLESRLATSEDGGSKPEQALRAALEEHRPAVHALLVSLDKLSEMLRSKSGPFAACHADLHPSNLLRDHAGNVYVVDWDDTILAPVERDFIFVGEPGSPFFDGYGELEIDWAALTYYRYERVVTDLIEDAEQVLFRDDLTERAKAEAAQRFRVSLEGRNFAAAQAAAARVPAQFTVRGIG